MRFGGDKVRDKLGLSTSPQYLEQAGRTQDAIHQYRTAGNFAAEAQLLEQTGAYEDAAKVYIRLQDWLKVSEMYAFLEDWEMSALYAKKGGDIDRAVGAFKKDNSPGKVAQILADEGLHKEAADLFLEAGEHVKAVHAYRAAGLEEQSMELMAKEYLRLGQYGRCGDCLIRLKRVDEAIEVFEKGRLFDKIAELYEAQGKLEEASRNFAKAGLFREAGSLLLKTGNFRGSARLFLQGGFSKRAFEILSKKEAWFEISRICLLLNKREEAFHFVKKIPVSDPEYADSRLHFANFFISENNIEEALAYLKEAVDELGLILPVKAHAFLIIDLLCRLQRFKEAEDMASSLENNLLVTEEERNDLQDLTTQLSKRVTSVEDGSEEQSASIVGAIHLPKFERYAIEREIGRGTQGIAYLAKDKVLDRKVVLKMLRDESLRNENARRYFLREAKIAASINHPNVVTLFDLGEIEGQPYTVMEYIEGITLEQYLTRQHKPLSFETIHQIFSGICHALDEAAQHGIVHRDVKPENIMMTIDGTVKLMDFGLARGWLESPEQSAILVGTPFYMSPEQIHGDPVDQRTDLYSAGIILYRMVVGHLPFRKGNILRLQRVELPQPPIELRPDLSKSRNALILSMLAKKPNERPDSALEALKRFELNEEVSGPRQVQQSADSLMPMSAASDEASEDVELTNFDPFSDVPTPESDDFRLIDEDVDEDIEGYGVETSSTLIPYGEKDKEGLSDA